MVCLLKCDHFGKIIPLLSMVFTISLEVYCRKDCWVQVFILKWTLFSFSKDIYYVTSNLIHICEYLNLIIN